MPSMTMRATQKNRMSKPVMSSEVGIESCEVLGLVGPAERGERPEAGAEPGVEHVGILLEVRRAAARAGGRGFARDDDFAASRQCQAGMRWPHQSWREMHQSRMLYIHSK